jgi:hypothetical protein
MIDPQGIALISFTAAAKKVLVMCKIGKLSFVAGAEIPKKYLVRVDGKSRS